MDFPDDLIELHNFENGYCGISKIEGQKNCLCYLTASDNLKRYGGDIKMMEREVLMKNPALKKYFENAEFLFEQPLAVSNIAIGFKGAVKDHVLLAGDAAGNIAPLSGNGMSMAMRSSFMLNQLISDFLSGNCSRPELEKKYEKIFRSQFKKRIDLSGILQKMLKNTRLTDSTISMLKRVAFLRNAVVRSTHGRPF
jgi:flavin-dependent dehydrogenase